MSNYEATKYDYTGANLSGIEGIPTATIVPWSSSSIPTGFLECNGAAVSRSTYSALFADLQDNVTVGKSNNKALASTGGADTVQSSGNIGGSTANATLSTAQLASHSHSQGGANETHSDPGGRGASSIGNTGSTGSGAGHSHNLSANFSGDATSVVQPYLTAVYIIKT